MLFYYIDINIDIYIDINLILTVDLDAFRFFNIYLY